MVKLLWRLLYGYHKEVSIILTPYVCQCVPRKRFYVTIPAVVMHVLCVTTHQWYILYYTIASYFLRSLFFPG